MCAVVKVMSTRLPHVRRTHRPHLDLTACCGGSTCETARPGTAPTTAPWCRAPTSTSRRRSTWSGRSATTSATAGSRRSGSTPPASTASSRPTSPSRARRCARPSPRSTRTSGPGSRSRSAGCGSPARPSSGADVVTDLGPGARVTQRLVPVDRVGLYVPGGVAPLVSSVLMNVVPAQVAGVGSIALTSSPQKAPFGSWGAGLPHPTILAACELLGIEEVYAVGGAQAIAMFAYGAGPCRRVDLVTGPGNIYTVSAKRLLKGVVGIDSEAGPTEIAILADDTADAAYVAADLISQAEHDPMAASVLVTDSLRLADEVEAEVDKQVAVTRHVERIRTALSGEQSGIVLVDDTAQGLEVINAYAAEHTEIQTADSAADAAKVRNAGAVFVGSVRAGVAGRLLRRLQPRAADRGLRLPLLGAVGALVPARGARRRVLPRRPRRGRRPRRPRWPTPRTCPVTVLRSACVSRRTMSPAELAAAPRGAARRRAVRRTAAARAGRAERQREPLPALAGGRRRHRGRRRRGGGDAEPLPRPRVHRAAQGPGRLPRAGGRRQPRPRAGLGRQRLQRGDAAAAAGLRRPRPHGGVVRPDVLDVSGVRPRRDDHLRRRPPPRRLRLRPRRGGARRRAAPALGRAAALAQQPDRHRAAARRDRRAVRDGAQRDRRHRRGLRRVPPRRHAVGARAAARSTATSWSPAR